MPVRLESTRLPGKALKDICGLPMIIHVLKRCWLSKTLDKVFVATDSQEVREVVEKFGGDVIMTSSKHKTGTDRIAEAAIKLDTDIVVNIQGDEPFINPEDINNLFDLVSKEEIEMATLYSDLKSLDELEDLNKVKILVNDGIASNFFRETSLENNIFIHQGVYAFKYKTLKSFVSWKPSDNEKKFKLEQFRALDNGIKINAIKSVSKIHLGVDTEDDLKKANEIAKDDSYK